MTNISFHALKALEAVCSCGSFQKAAVQLRITQSAVTQRIQQLEDQAGSMVMTRTNPPHLTEVGEKLMKFTKQYIALESELLDSINNTTSPHTQKISIALNYDSMSSWFLPTIKEVLKRKSVLIECVLQHEKRTIDALRAGKVGLAISSDPKPIVGGEAVKIGTLRYLCVGTKSIKGVLSRSKGLKHFFQTAPTVFFSNDDYVCEQFYRGFSLESAQLPHHIIPSNAELYELIRSGLCYGLAPEPQAREDLKRGALINLSPKHEVHVDLYLHYWRQGTALYQELVSIFLDDKILNV